MPHQMQLNQGPQDALLYDNSRSYFLNVGYVRTSNFQVEYKTVDSQNNMNWGSAVTFTIPQSADLLGPTELHLTIPAVQKPDPTVDGSNPVNHNIIYEWVDQLGFAIIEKVTFKVGANEIESITGEQLQIRNELMTSDEMRLGYDTVMKTGCKSFGKTWTMLSGSYDDSQFISGGGGAQARMPRGKGCSEDRTRIITQYVPVTDTEVGFNCENSTVASATHDAASGNDLSFSRGSPDRKLIIPLSLFYTQHVSQYFPLAAIAGCENVQIIVKLKDLNKLFKKTGYTGGGAATARGAITAPSFASAPAPNKIPAPTGNLFCHFVHVTGPEAQLITSREHVRLLKLWQHQPETWSQRLSGKHMSFNLSFLHPVSTLIITIRNTRDLGTQVRDEDAESATAATYKYVGQETGESGKGHFFYHGNGTYPNYDDNEWYSFHNPGTGSAATRTSSATTNTGADASPATIKLRSIDLKLNGNSRHPGLDKGIPADVLQHRLLPMLHSNSNQSERDLQSIVPGHYTLEQEETNSMEVLDTLLQKNKSMKGASNIFVYPFSLNPEGSNPSGAVNFSKVSHAVLDLHFEDGPGSLAAYPASGLHDAAVGGPSHATREGEWQVDIYALYYNWLQIKDGRALLSFA
jgi:hypothetical protein